MDSGSSAEVSSLKTAWLDERGKQSAPDAMLITAFPTFWFDNARFVHSPTFDASSSHSPYNS
jgi:hypothetical protein